MGALHQGHRSLFQQARNENDIVIASVFVNPSQFGPNEDFDRYPRMPEKDCKLLEEVGVDAVFLPTTDQMYKPDHRMFVVPEGYDNLPESIKRPGHFRGVATVVAKLLNLVHPHNSYFGQKDALQCVVLTQLVQDLNLPGSVVICPTVREADGLAMSSRNAYLNAEERLAATTLFRALTAMKAHWNVEQQKGKNSSVKCADLKDIGMRILRDEPLITSIDYLSIGCKKTMNELAAVAEQGAIISVAVKLGSVRLIDNMLL